MLRCKAHWLCWVLSITFSTAFFSVAHAETAQEMKSYCKPVVDAVSLPDGKVSFDTTFLSGVCWGSIGTLLKLGLFYDRENGPILDYCAPEAATTTQYATIFSNYVDRHPEKMHEDWEWVAILAMREAFPCE